ncbi:MAG TPA: MFS transporter [Terricaulis sp.]|nr:MFS transporter [Terricaulis sp.]
MPYTNAAPPDAPARLNITPLLFVGATFSMSMMAFVALIGPISRELGVTTWQAGAAVTVSGVLWMALAPYWGQRSDRVGRRIVLLTCMAGCAISYALLCVFMEWALHIVPAAIVSFIGMMIGRGAMGAFYAGVPPTTFALIADHLPPEKRAGAMAAFGAANASGMAIGPAAAGLLAQVSLTLPLFVTALLPIAVLALAWRVLPRDSAHERAPPQKIRFNDTRLLRPMATAFCAMFAVSVAQIVVGFFALDRLGLDTGAAAQAAGLALTSVGVALIGSQMLVGRIRWSPRRFIRVGCVIGAIGFASVALSTNVATLCAAYFVAAAGMGWVFPSFSALAANSVEPHEQGAAAGAVAAAQGFGMVLGPFVGAVIYGFGPATPYLLAGALLLACAAWPQRR